MEKQKLLVIAGEIISADSMQVYKGMDIGTAKVTPEETEGIPHHLIDVLEPTEEWNVALFQEQAEAAIRDIASRGRLPILCGGTGFYLHALLYGDRQMPPHFPAAGGDRAESLLRLPLSGAQAG